MAEERPVDATDESVLDGSCKRVLLAAEGEDIGGTERVLAGGAERVLAGVAEGDAPDDLGVKELLKLLLLLCCCGYRPCNSFSASIASWNNWLVVLNSL
jgi:hypothetical protein